MTKVYIVKATKDNGFKGGFALRLRPDSRTDSLPEELQVIVKSRLVILPGKENAFDERLLHPTTAEKYLKEGHVKAVESEVSDFNVKAEYKISDEDWTKLCPHLSFSVSDLAEFKKEELTELCSTVFENAEVPAVVFKNVKHMKAFLSAGV